MIKINFAENLRNLRKANDLTQRQLAGITGVNQRTVSAWEKGICQPDFETLALICEYFHETFDSILT